MDFLVLEETEAPPLYAQGRFPASVAMCDWAFDSGFGYSAAESTATLVNRLENADLTAVPLGWTVPPHPSIVPPQPFSDQSWEGFLSLWRLLAYDTYQALKDQSSSFPEGELLYEHLPSNPDGKLAVTRQASLPSCAPVYTSCDPPMPISAGYNGLGSYERSKGGENSQAPKDPSSSFPEGEPLEVSISTLHFRNSSLYPSILSFARSAIPFS